MRCKFLKIGLGFEGGLAVLSVTVWNRFVHEAKRKKKWGEKEREQKRGKRDWVCVCGGGVRIKERKRNIDQIVQLERQACLQLIHEWSKKFQLRFLLSQFLFWFCCCFLILIFLVLTFLHWSWFCALISQIRELKLGDKQGKWLLLKYFVVSTE